jgi:hypothetical protein
VPNAPIDWVPVINNTGDTIPAGGLIVSNNMDANGNVIAAQPTENGQLCLVNDLIALPTGQIGQATFDNRVRMAYDVCLPAPNAGETWGSSPGSWLAINCPGGSYGFLIVGGAGSGVVNATRTDSACTATTTTSSPAACSGQCYWTYSSSAKTWTLQSSSCPSTTTPSPSSTTTASPGCPTTSSPGQPACNCAAPDFCPSSDGCTFTNCIYISANQKPVNCSGTTTTQSPSCSTTPSGCGGSCTWYIDAVGNFSPVSLGCDPVLCPCPTPSTSLIGSTRCGNVITQCSTPGACESQCQWVWDTLGDGGWIGPFTGCFVNGTTIVAVTGACACDLPNFSGSVCGQQTYTPCYYHNQNLGCYTTTTCSPSSGNCGCVGNCYWQASGSSWSLSSGCPSCVCTMPTYTPSASCQIAVNSCQPPGTTSTTTTTPSPPTTTTTTTCSGNCIWYCDPCYGGLWNLSTNNCGAGCNCNFPSIMCGSGGGLTFTPCIAGLTTTTSTPTTTTFNPACATTTSTTVTPTTTTHSGTTTTPSGTTTTTTSGPYVCCNIDGDYNCVPASSCSGTGITPCGPEYTTLADCQAVACPSYYCCTLGGMYECQGCGCFGGWTQVSGPYSSNPSCLVSCGSGFTSTTTTANVPPPP